MKKLEIPRCFRCLKSEQPFHHPHHGGISSERQDTPTTGPPQAPDRTPPRQDQPARLPPTHVHRQQHPLRDRRPQPRHRPRRHRRHPPPGPASSASSTPSTRRPAPAQDPPALPRIRSRPQPRLQRPVRRHLPAKTSNCAATTRSSSTPSAPAASPIRPPPATSAAASRPPTSTPCSRHLQRRPHRRLGRAARRVLRPGHHRHGRHAGRDHRRVQAGHGHRLRRHLGLPPAGRVAGQHRRGAEPGQPLRQSALARRRRRPGRSRPGGLLARRLPPGPAARRHRLHPDRAPRPLGRRPARAASSSASTPCPTWWPSPTTLPANGLAAAGARRPATHVQTEPRQRPDNVKDQIVVAREFETMRLHAEEVAEFDYRPTACAQTYRLIVVRKNISVEKGEQRAVRRRSATSSTSPTTANSPAAEIVFSANDRCNQENLHRPAEGRRARPAGAGGQPGEQLGVHGDDGAGLEPEGVVGAVAARSAGPLAGATPRARSSRCCGWSSRRFVNAFVRSAVPDRPHGPPAGLSAAVLEPVPADLLPPGRVSCAADAAHLEVGVRMLRSAAANGNRGERRTHA